MKLISLSITIIILMLGQCAYAQMAVNTDGSSAETSAMLDVSSTTKGFLAPRMLASERSAIISPATGLLVYQTDGSPGYYYFTGTEWTQLGVASQASQWATAGSDIYYNSGNVGVGTGAPSALFQLYKDFGGNTNTPFFLASDNVNAFYMFPRLTESAYNLGVQAGDFGMIMSQYKPLFLGVQDGEGIRISTNTITMGANNGNVGIGTTSPPYKLSVNTSNMSSAFDAGNLSTWVAQEIFAPATVDGTGRGLMFNCATGTEGSGLVGISKNTTGGRMELAFVTSTGNNAAERMRIDENGNVGIGTSSPASTLDVAGNIECSGFTADYTNTYTIDATYSSGTWFNVIPVNILPVNATYIVSIHFNNNSWGPPYYLDASTIVTTSSSNGNGTGNEVALPSASHVASSSYYFSVRNRMASGNVSTGLDVQLNGFESHNNETITVTAKRIF